MKKVRIIPPIPKEYKKLKVAGYCRVSTSGPAQLRSLEIQIKTYKKMIRSHPDWIYAGVFYDVESGLRRNGRTDLNKMLRKAAKGEIDYIITKSISRVSRDTLEILQIIRFLRERGINMHFETEDLDSINVDKEFEITLRGMLAQDESRNTSENIQWGFQRKFEKGDIFTQYKNFMGYTCVDGDIVIVPEQAEVVRKIFDLYLQGLSLGQIKAYLQSQGIKTVTGKDVWDRKTIQKILKNEKYKGDTMLQKTFTEDFMTGKKVKNIGQRGRYYIKDSHPAIVSAEVFDKVQEEMAKRASIVRNEDGTVEASGIKYNGKYLLGNLLVCGYCGTSYRRRTERGKVVWRCSTRIEIGKGACPNSPTLDEEWVKDILRKTYSNGICEEDLREKISKIKVYTKHITVFYKNDGETVDFEIWY
ncbi:recombinase family protein [Sinanaerobacter chloroacetimidivorans]|uniref:Recombinase family protein n=1 Tax=Sinanaerobacter chloroacetimidivorans TaxID=2818044 RepID=A0A8J7W2P5_9FIRM|nr:recombinase family protein [Sinanaerobacter chloroacetimidivorans]MBR0599774.1 recombinase family protein [Sinanaerobacter chloroacetimidivorans]